jgi:hypothetical protein
MEKKRRRARKPAAAVDTLDNKPRALRVPIVQKARRRAMVEKADERATGRNSC